MSPITPEVVVVIDKPKDEELRRKRKHPGYYDRCQVAKLLKRHPKTLNRYHNALLINNDNYRKFDLGPRKGWHPYQIELLAKVSNFQFRTRDPRINRDEDELIKYILDHADIWTEENWIANNYQLPIKDDHNNQRAS